METQRTDWFESARFGMFLHWGLYALLGRGEWVRNREQVPADEYASLADRFDPVDYDPRAWAQLAVETGMKYVVLTTKHHEGFCLWDSKACSFNAVNSGAKRDLLAEYVEAVRGAGLKVGFYYSLGDWHHPDWKAGYEGDTGAADRFMDYTHELVRELMTGYGRIDILWYDLPQNYSAAQWRSVDLNAKVRQLQPHILINNRAMTTEDFATPEQHITAAQAGRMWESCMTLNRSWGYCPSDTDYKSPREVVQSLASAAAGGGNLLLNVGPDPAGRIPEPAQEVLRQVGGWLETHGQAIYGSQRHGMSWNLWGPTTARDNTAYLHLERCFGDRLTVGALTGRVERASLLTTGQALRVEQDECRAILTGLPKEAADPLMSVVKLELDRPPAQDFTPSLGTADIFPDLPA